MLHRLCGPPSIPLSFNLAAVLPRRRTYRVSFGTERQTLPTPSSHRLQRGLPGYLILFAPTLSHLSVSLVPGGRLRHWCSSGYLRISPLHPEFRHPLTDSSQAVSNAIPRLSPGLSQLTYQPPTRALRPVIPINACTLRITAAAGTELAGASSVGNVKPRSLHAAHLPH